MMRNSKIAMVLLMVGILNACSMINKEKPVETQKSKPDYANAEEMISLQNLKNRNIVYCYNSEQQSSEVCAKYFEKKGYTRFRDIPYKTAKYDFLKKDTYPTRRWRDGEQTPRW